MQDKKYQLLRHDTIVRDGRTLYRIEALHRWPRDLQKGEKGGYVESEANLSQEGSCWLFDDACAYEDARVEGEACLYDQATLRGKAKLLENAILRDHAVAEGEAIIRGWSSLQQQASVTGHAVLEGKVQLEDFVHVGGNAYLKGDPIAYLWLTGNTMILGDTFIHGYGTLAQRDAIFEEGSFKILGDYCLRERRKR